MPLYEYQCGACQARVEKLQKLSDAPLVNCPECGADALVRLMSAAGFRLKGSGWYETDFKKDGKRNLAADDKPTAEKSGGTEPKSTDSTAATSSKPAEKSDTKSAATGSGSGAAA